MAKKKTSSPITTAAAPASKPGPLPRLRRLVREVLKAEPSRAFTVEALAAQMLIMDQAATGEQARAALRWNFEAGHVNYQHNHELEADLWFLTTRGQHADDPKATL